mmetsp:Transcript_2051/g.5687  ORF Transcript_2051/g.5687 Transcript_2051/m.5687 type:complete len:238 (-) Transcript_2051:26-739(-)
MASRLLERLLGSAKSGIVVGEDPNWECCDVVEGVLSISNFPMSVDHVLSCGFKRVVNCMGGDFMCKVEEYTERFKERYLHLNLIDHPAAPCEHYFDAVADFVQSGAKRGEKTLIHCAAGVSRSSTMVIAYLIKYQDLTLDAALARVREARPSAKPNEGFFVKLMRFQAQLTGPLSDEYRRSLISNYIQIRHPQLEITDPIWEEVREQLDTNHCFPITSVVHKYITPPASNLNSSVLK